MEAELRRLIAGENPKNPYTDDQIAGMLRLRRDQITAARHAWGIPDSRERRHPHLIRAIRAVTASNPQISNSELTNRLKQDGFQLSRFTVTQFRQELDCGEQSSEITIQASGVPTGATEKVEPGGVPGVIDRTGSAFDEIIGARGSLKQQIKQVKAAVLYPPYGLHLLIIGPTGVGKSNLAEAVYNYAVEVGKLSQTSPFVVFNCADYADNPQLLLSQLFGHAKGAYTGAATAKAGLVEKADKGILFLDEVHRLPPEGQELLYYLMDHGKYRRLGETESMRSVSVMIIAATTENIESSLLLTFRRRIPMIIDLPPLRERPLTEKYLIIKHFLRKESVRIGTPIKVTREALRALMLNECPGNIGQLRSDIQVACAKGFLNCLNERADLVTVGVRELSFYARSRMQHVWQRHPEVDSLLKVDLEVGPSDADAAMPVMGEMNLLEHDIYQYTEERFGELRKQGASQEIINEIIGEELEIKFEQMIRHTETDTDYPHELSCIVEPEIVGAMQVMREVLEPKIEQVGNSLYYCIAIHLNATLKRLRQGKNIHNPKRAHIQREYPLEYALAQELAGAMAPVLGLRIPDDETAFLAMYLRTVTQPTNLHSGKVGVIVLSHGHAAGAMAEVANAFLNINHAHAVGMALDEPPEQALERTVEMVRCVNEGKGVLLLADMGSLAAFDEQVTQRTGIPVRVVDRADTVMVMEALRRALLPETVLDELADGLKKGAFVHGITAPHAVPRKTLAVVTVCVTGQGAAVAAVRMLEQAVPGIRKLAQIIPLAMLGEEDITAQMRRVEKEHAIAAVVGTINPSCRSIPFFSLDALQSGACTASLEQLLRAGVGAAPPPAEAALPAQLIPRELIQVHPEQGTRVALLEQMVTHMVGGGYVEPDYMLDVYKREVMGSPVYRNGVAIPHGTVENVLKPAIALSILREPLEWSGANMVRIVFMLALREDGGAALRWLHSVISDDAYLSELAAMKDADEVHGSLLRRQQAFNVSGRM